MLVNAYCTARNLPALDFPHHLLNQRDRSDPTMPAHLDGFLDYLFPEGSEMSSGLYALMRHVQRVVYQVSLEVEDSDNALLGHWLEQAQGVAFLPDGSVRDAKGRTLFHPQQEPDEDAQLPVAADALQRKSSNQRRLEGEGVQVPDHLPTVISEGEVELRPAREVAQRALALFLVALRAESMAAGDPIPADEMEERQPIGFAALSPEERSYMLLENPPQDTTVSLSWRYEALLILLWSLGLVELPPATEICDVSAIVGLLMESEESEIAERATLRYPSIILDALDLHYRYHWAVRQAEMAQAEPPADLVPGVVLERHYALNWLTCFENAPWDEIDTPT